ncbi:MAG TPA: Lrp/AsnC family transcriptional regulator [Propionicimonas sp.]|nr:Lrp/AsnC family transcriptional regulator [Propionicimonas sp.]
MDSLDEKIIDELRQNARLSFSELGRRVGLSTSAVATRVRHLETDGVIGGYTIMPGPRGVLRPGLEVFIDLRLDAATDDDAFLAAIKPLREVTDAAHLTGPYDFLVRAVVADTAALDALVKRLKSTCGAAQTQTRVALRPAMVR